MVVDNLLMDYELGKVKHFKYYIEENKFDFG